MPFVPDETVNKLILLFVLDKMEIPLTENSLMDICSGRNNWLNYMECKDLLNKLIDANFVYKIAGDEEKYNISYEGRNCLSHFFNRIPQSKREEISEFSKQNRMIFKRSQEYVSDYFKNPDGSHTVVLRIKEPMIAQPMFEIRIKTSTRTAAINACKRWREKAPSVYENIYDSIIND